MKRINGFIHSSFKKDRLTAKPNPILELLYSERSVLRIKRKPQVSKNFNILENELCEKYSESMFKKIMTEVNGADNCEDGGFNAGNLWKLRKKLSPRNQDPPTAMYNDSGKLLTRNEEIVRETELHYRKLFEEKPIKPEHEK